MWKRKLIKDRDNHVFYGSHVSLQFRYDCLPRRFTQQDKPSCWLSYAFLQRFVTVQCDEDISKHIHPHRSKYSNTLYLCRTWLQGPHGAHTKHYSLITFHKSLQRWGGCCANPANPTLSEFSKRWSRMVLKNPARNLNFLCKAAFWIKCKKAWAGHQKRLCL